jgi:hypothetical protein
MICKMGAYMNLVFFLLVQSYQYNINLLIVQQSKPLMLIKLEPTLTSLVFNPTFLDFVIP